MQRHIRSWFADLGSVHLRSCIHRRPLIFNTTQRRAFRGSCNLHSYRRSSRVVLELFSSCSRVVLELFSSCSRVDKENDTSCHDRDFT